MDVHANLKRILALVLTGCGIAALYLSWSWPIIHDAATNHYIAQQILKGQIPYSDIFDMNLPGTYLPHLFTLFAMGTSDWAWRITEYLFLFVGIWAIWRLCKDLKGAVGITAAMSWLLFHIGNGAVLQGQRDLWVAILLVLACVFLYRSWEGSRDSREDLFLTSLFIGAATMIKPIAVVFLPLLLILHLSRSDRKILWLRLITSSSIGFLIFPLGLVIWLAFSGSLSDFFDITINYTLSIYSEIKVEGPMQSFLQYGKILGFVSLAIGSLILWQMKRTIKSPSLSLLVAGCIYGVFHFLFQAKGWNYQSYPFFIFAIPLFLSVLDFVSKSRKKSPTRTIAMGLMLLVSVGIAAKGIVRAMGDESLESNKAFVLDLRDDLSSLGLEEGSSVQVMDTAAGGLHALYLSGFQQASRFMYDFHFHSAEGESYVQNMKADLISQLKESNPKALVIIKAGWLPPRDYSRFDSFTEFNSLLRDKYRLAKESDSYKLYTTITN